MLGFQEYHDLSQSAHAEERGRAARIAARAFLEHDGPADEQAALYAAVLSFLDDSSVKGSCRAGVRVIARRKRAATGNVCPCAR